MTPAQQDVLSKLQTGWFIRVYDDAIYLIKYKENWYETGGLKYEHQRINKRTFNAIRHRLEPHPHPDYHGHWRLRIKQPQYLLRQEPQRQRLYNPKGELVLEIRPNWVEIPKFKIIWCTTRGLGRAALNFLNDKTYDERILEPILDYLKGYRDSQKV